MSHTTCVARAVAVTLKPGTDAVADAGPHVAGVTCTHIHTGRPTSPIDPGRGAIPISGPRIGSWRIALAASICGVTAGTAPAPGPPATGSGRHTQPPALVPGENGMHDAW
jgi:hypothetical protein